MKSAQIDRVEGAWAVIVIEGVKHPVNIPVIDLPEGIREEDYLPIEMRNGEAVAAVLDPEGKAKAKKRIQDKLNRLRRGDHLKG